MTQNLHPLRVWRMRRDMTLDDLARQVGVTGPLISRIELGRDPPSAKLAVRINKATGVALFHLRPDLWPPPQPRRRGQVRL